MSIVSFLLSWSFPFLIFGSIFYKLQFDIYLYDGRKPKSKRIPGPRLAAWSRLWLLKNIFFGQLPDKLVELPKQYGPVVRIGPNHIIVSDPESIRRVLATSSKYTRGPWFDTLRLHPTITNVISERDPEKHQQLRAMLGPGLSGRGFPPIESAVNEQIKVWIDVIHERYISKGDELRKLDLAKSIPHLTVDLISRLCLGEALGCTRRESDPYGFIDSTRAGMLLQQYTTVLSEIQTLIAQLGKLPFLRRFVYPTPKDTLGVAPVMTRIQQVLEARENQEGDLRALDMLDIFLSRGLPREQVYMELVIILAGGTDTTSTAVQGILVLLLLYPPIYTRLQVEIDTFCAENADELEYPIQDSLARKLPYLQACITEGLRKCTPLFQLRERVVPPEGDLLNGHFVPGGTFVGINNLATQNADVFGKDVVMFRPQRWLTADAARLKHMHQTLDLGFGYGNSKCLGVNLAYMEMNKIVFELFRQFRISIVNPFQPWRREGRGIFVQYDFFVRIENRETVNS